MPLTISNVRLQRSAGTTATTLSENINFGFRAHALHIDLYSLKNTTSTANILIQLSKLSQVRINTTRGQPESTIDGSDLYDFHPAALGRVPYHAISTATDNIPHLITMTYPFSPFPDDPTEPFGLDPNLGTQVDLQFIADASLTTASFDTFTYDLTVEGLTNAPSNGYLRFLRDSQTGVVGNTVNTKVYGKRFLGVFNWATTSYDDLAASVAVDVTTIRTQSILQSSAVILGPMRPARAGATQYVSQTTAVPEFVSDDSVHFQNFGINNRGGALGFDISGQGTIELATTAGAANAYRTYPVTLV